MGTSLKNLIILLSCVSTLSAEEIRLSWTKGAKAKVETEVLTDLEMQVGENPAENAKGTEKIFTAIEIAGNEAEVSELPISILYTLSDYQATLELKEAAVQLGLGEPGTDFFYGELKTLKEKPVLLIMKEKDKGFNPATPNSPYTEIFETKRAQNLLLNRLHEIFFLAGEDLKVGKTIEGEVDLGENFKDKAKLSFKVKEITPDQVKAVIFYVIPRQKGALGDINPTSGSARGKAVFSRKNPLDFELDMSGKFSSSKKIEEGKTQKQSYTLNMKVHGASS